MKKYVDIEYALTSAVLSLGLNQEQTERLRVMLESAGREFVDKDEEE